MSQIKISQLTPSNNVNANSALSLFPTTDLGTGQTTQLSAAALGNSLYANNTLVVGSGGVVLPNIVAQFTGTNQQYVQVNLQNIGANGSADLVITGDTGTDANTYLDLGFNNSNFVNTGFTSMGPNDGYLYVQGTGQAGASGNLVIGTASPNTEIKFMASGTNDDNVVMKVKYNDVKFRPNTIVNVANTLLINTITFYDSTTLNSFSAISNNAANIANLQSYSNSAYAFANTINVTQTGINTTQNSWISSNSTFTQSAYNQANVANSIANTAVQNTTTISVRNLNITGNMVANTVNTSVSFNNITSNNATFSNNVTILGNLTSNTLLGNIFFSNVVTTTTQSNSILWFGQSTPPTQIAGQVWYNLNTVNLVLDTDIINDRADIGKVLYERVFNSTGSTIPANSWVRLTSSGVTANQIPYVQLADATSAANATVSGFVKNAIANGTYGFQYTKGIVSTVNMSVYNNGDLLFLTSTPGVASNVAPTGSNTVVQLGRVISNDSVNGKLQVDNILRQAYGRVNGSVLYAYANNITSSNTLSINDSTGTLTSNNITANTITLTNGVINAVRANSTSPLTINFTTDMIVRANLSANFTVTPANFVAGKTIDVWLTNTSTGGPGAHTITHGVSALNSTVGATTFTLTASQSALLKYMCADGTSANTFVAITYQ